MDVTKKKLVLQESIWRKEILKTRGSEYHKLTSSEALSLEADVIRGYEQHQKLENWKLQRLSQLLLEIKLIIAEAYKH